ncbi:hypothetical protein TcBrA4_0091900 [Trypanosoma cruzi]|nr:hypothetical protein TcBrA4_0091900 [Trypanosoma cruzi]
MSTGSGSPGDSHCGRTIFSRRSASSAHTDAACRWPLRRTQERGLWCESEKASDLSQLTDTWSTGIVALAKSIIRARQLKPEACRSTAAVDWDPRPRTPPSLVGWRPHWPASAAVFRTNTDDCYDHCSPPSHAHAVGAARMRTAGTQRTSHGSASSFRWTHPATIRTAGRLSGVRKALQLPH